MNYPYGFFHKNDQSSGVTPNARNCAAKRSAR